MNNKTFDINIYKKNYRKKYNKYTSNFDINILTEKQINHFWNGMEKTNDCWNWIRHTNKDGYGWTSFNDINVKSSRVALLLTTNQPIDKPLALHKCKKNRKCCNPEHLYWGTNIENMQDLVNDGHLKGILNPSSKLTEKEVLEIRQNYETHNFTYKSLADKYNVNKCTISRIILKQTWKHI